MKFISLFLVVTCGIVPALTENSLNVFLVIIYTIAFRIFLLGSRMEIQFREACIVSFQLKWSFFSWCSYVLICIHTEDKVGNADSAWTDCSLSCSRKLGSRRAAVSPRVFGHVKSIKVVLCKSQCYTLPLVRKWLVLQFEYDLRVGGYCWDLSMPQLFSGCHCVYQSNLEGALDCERHLLSFLPWVRLGLSPVPMGTIELQVLFQI